MLNLILGQSQKTFKTRHVRFDCWFYTCIFYALVTINIKGGVDDASQITSNQCFLMAAEHGDMLSSCSRGARDESILWRWKLSLTLSCCKSHQVSPGWGNSLGVITGYGDLRLVTFPPTSLDHHDLHDWKATQTWLLFLLMFLTHCQWIMSSV